MSGLTPLSRARACRAACSMPGVPVLYRLVTVAPMALNGTRTLRGALAGATAAAVWAAQSPLDKRVFGVDYDDVELLGKLVTREPAWFPIGLAAHIRNGALFRALYAHVAPSMPVPRAPRGPLAGLIEHLATWPATILLERVHPAAGEMPELWGDPRAFAQATWRHTLFGLVMGELERRLNPGADSPAPIDDAAVASN